MPDILVEPSVEFIYSPVINFALQQNHVPVVRKLVIKNTTRNDLHNITVEITSEPDFAVIWKYQVDHLVKDENIEISPINLRISSKYLSELTERVAGTFTVTVSSNEEVVSKHIHDVSILAFDQWNGIHILPEMLSAFITPNHPEIIKVIKRASSILQKWTGSPSFDSYQTQNPDRVRKQMAAIYEAIAEMEITYVTVPASFEATGQRVRLCDVIFSQKIGNCLDLSLLYAACLEAVGINPLMVIIKGHAFAGAWLIDDSFADSTNDDVSLITKRAADGINEIAVVEATCMNAGQKASFDDSVRAANQHLVKEEDFLLFVDVKRSRFSGIRPLPLRIQTLNGWEIVEPVSVDRNFDIPEEIMAGPKLVQVDKVDVSKQSLWERKLLDLSLRNNLLNLRITKTTIQLLSVSLHKLEDALATGNEFQILPKPADWDNPHRSAGLYHSLHQSDPIADLVKQEFSQKRLRAYLTETELAANMTDLYRAARLSLEENGANTLYIALGVLKWYETNISERPRFAPILLLPVDIIKKAAQKGFVIRSREEDTMMNITLLEMMRQDFGIHIGGLETLPKDESGVDVRSVFSILRQGIMSQSRWDVEEQAFLGTFSFSKFIMWNDIHNNADKLRKNKVVASLMSGKMEWHEETEEKTVHLDKQYHPADIALPISTDSSQLEAIAESVNNKSFILHGPPGTGKSQTITNIIANALYNGKKVLFVAEKMAALNVVHDRLKAIGLGPFCLELHSNKTKKSVVLDQLKKTSEITKSIAPETFWSEAERIHALRSELNSYVEALHHNYHFGFSLYDSFTGYARFEIAKGNIAFRNEAIDALTKQQVTEWNDLAEELQTAGTIIGHPHNHPLREINATSYTSLLKNEARELLPKYITALGELRSANITVSNFLKITVPPASDDKLNVLKLIATLLLQLPDTPATMIAADNFEQTLSQVMDIIAHGKKRDTLRDELIHHYNKAILSFDAQQNLAQWNEASEKWFLPKWLGHRSIKKAVKKLSLSGNVDDDRIVPLFEKIIQYQQEQSHLDANESFLSPLLGFLWKAGNPDWDNLAVICNTLLQLNRQVIMLFENATDAKKWRKVFAQECEEGTKSFLAYSNDVLNKYIDSYNTALKIENDVRKLLAVDFSNTKEGNVNKVDACQALATRWLSNIESIRDWCNWNNVKQKAVNAGLSPLVHAYEQGNMQSNEVVSSYKKSLYRSCAEYIFSKNEQLASFNGRQFQDKIRRFREISAAFEKLTREELHAKLASKIPSFTQEASQSSEVGILQRAIRTNGRGNSIRKLFDSIPNLLPRMNPCMLMSPISVAQYFDAGTTKFDLVVFDEASQMPTCEAVGAIARGNNVVIVGDPKQMPPTNFFSSTRVDEENFDKEDLESILDDCLALSMPSKHLLWHYRSKHESLIAFSNSKYYENKLFTFPSPDDISSKVKFVNIEGYYDRGKTKHNRAEAKAIVDEIVMRLTDPVLCKQSIGVVTFSTVQQILIDDMLNEVLTSRPELEALVMQSAEPIFIKNLENVQGDERDVILFSVGYGPDKEGKVSLNFGPINREGGWRRLNVAVSRARYEMKVFSTLKADRIDITRSASEGVAGLQSFLEYAEKGKEVLAYRNGSKRTAASGLVEVLATEIRKHGYEAHTNIGCSGYKMDIGVVDAANSGEYILGILCDGHNYSAAKTARDREIVQPDVLKLLGWNIYKLWSTEWWENAEKEMQGVIDAIKGAEIKKSAPVALKEPEPPAKLASVKDEDLVFNKAVFIIPGVVQKQAIKNAYCEEYKVARLDKVATISSDDFLLAVNRQKICEQVMQVIETEAPVSRNLLCKRVLAAWGISRLGTRLSAHFNILLPTLNLQTTGTGNDVFFWKPAQSPEAYHIYRTPKTEAEKRDAEDLCPDEIANVIKQVVTNQISLSKEELVKETAKIFGFARIGNNVEQAMMKGIEAAIEKGFVRDEGGRVVLV